MNSNLLSNLPIELNNLTIFYIICGASLLGIVYVLFSLKNDDDDISVRKLDPGEMAAQDYLSDRPVMLDLGDESLDLKGDLEKPKKKKGVSIFAKLKDLKSKLPEKKEKKPKVPKPPKTPKPPKEPKAKKPLKDKPKLNLSFLKKFTGKIKFGKKSKNPYADAVPEATPFTDFATKVMANTEKNDDEEDSTGTAAMAIPDRPTLRSNVEDSDDNVLPLAQIKDEEPKLSKEEIEEIEHNVEFSTQLEELNQKYQRLENLFNEKSGKLDKTEKKLSEELKMRKDFNKVKDILEKEIKEIREKSKEIKQDLNASKSENDSYKKRISQLEEKSTLLEKDLYAKEKETEELIEKLQREEERAKEDSASQKSAVTESLPEEKSTAEEIPDNHPETITHVDNETAPAPEPISSDKPENAPAPIQKDTKVEDTPESPKAEALEPIIEPTSAIEETSEIILEPAADTSEIIKEPKDEENADITNTIELPNIDAPNISYDTDDHITAFESPEQTSSEPIYVEEINQEDPAAPDTPAQPMPEPHRIKMPEDPYENKSQAEPATDDSPPIFMGDPVNEDSADGEKETEFLSLSPDPIVEENPTDDDNNPDKIKE